MPPDGQKRKHKTTADGCQGFQRTSASNLSWAASSTSSKSPKGHRQAQDLRWPTSAGMKTKTASSATKPIPRNVRTVPTSDPSTAIR